MEISNLDSFLEYYKRVRERTLHVVNCIPPDKIRVDEPRRQIHSGDLVRHLAALERYTLRRIR